VQYAWPFFKIYLPVTALFIITIAIARTIWLEQFNYESVLPDWIESIIFVPFLTVISVAMFRCFETGHPPNSLERFKNENPFWILLPAHFIVGLTYWYTLNHLQQNISTDILQAIYGESWQLLPPKDSWIYVAVFYAANLGVFTINALITISIMGFVWIIVAKNEINFTLLVRLCFLFPMSLLFYFVIMEIITNQIYVFYYYSMSWIGVIPDTGIDAILVVKPWRENLKLEFMHELSYLPFGFMINLIWLTAIDTAYRYLMLQSSR